ncbi:hypothetical protein BDA99DRAFT_575509 [Phascolomyces articulosus]|uniref:Uncharacterized protein n=1 Tax=Phascolomyces articulosus TaxID=60185 RepID=A0AAD5P9D0_9FUNG|nr:hypothetical protein BDA99DRAFT_575509 [Phascolomyces articulosus]
MTLSISNPSFGEYCSRTDANRDKKEVCYLLSRKKSIQAPSSDSWFTPNQTYFVSSWISRLQDHEGTSSYEKTTAATTSCLEVVNCTIYHAILGMIIPKLMDKDSIIA